MAKELGFAAEVKTMQQHMHMHQLSMGGGTKIHARRRKTRKRMQESK